MFLCFFKLPVEDLCSLPSQSLPDELISVVPESTEDVLLKGFTSLGMEEERIETAQQVNGSIFSVFSERRLMRGQNGKFLTFDTVIDNRSF